MPPETRSGQAKETHALPFAPESTARARELLDAFVSELSPSKRCQQEAIIVLGELVSNALDHGSAMQGGCFNVSFSHSAEALVVSVSDGGAKSAPHVVNAGPYAARGRGLAMVQALCLDWRVDRSAGTSVHATLSC